MPILAGMNNRRFTRMTRALLALLLIGALAGGLAACGRKGKPEHPPGSDYPRSYPAR